MRFKEFISEGGWGSTITQATKLTPGLAKRAISVLPKFEKDFNEFLKNMHLAPIEIGKAVGSSAYIDRDIESNPSKEYGDIDVIFVIPRIDRLSESKNNSIYRKALASFILSSEAPSYLYADPATTGHHIIVKTGDDWVQIDMVTAFTDTADWTTHRVTPEHNVKGALIGFLYASLAEVLNLSINTTGVMAKEIGDALVPYKKIKVDRQFTLTTDIGTFLKDILEAYFKRSQGDGTPKIAPLLKSHPGMKREHIQIKDLANGIKGLGMSFAANDMFGKKDLKHIDSFDDFISQLKSAYKDKVDSAINDTKFNKAETPEAIKRAEATKETLATKSKEILNLL